MDSQAVLEDDIEIQFNRNTTTHYAFSNPRMILSDNGSLVIRKTQLDDSGQYKCVSEKSSSQLFELAVITSKPSIHSPIDKIALDGRDEETNTASIYSDIQTVPAWLKEDMEDEEVLFDKDRPRNHSEIMKEIGRIEESLSKDLKERNVRKDKPKNDGLESGNLIGLIVSSIILIAVILGINLVLLGMICTLFLE